MKVTEVKIAAGKDVIIVEPGQVTWVIGGKSGTLPGKLAAKLYKSIATTTEPYFDLLKGAKASDFKS